MSYSRVYWLYLLLVIALPSALVAIIVRGWLPALAAFVVLLLLSARPLHPIFHALFRRFGDRSLPALQNTALRLMMTEKEPAAQLSRLAPGADLTALLALAARARDALIAAGAEIDAGRSTEPAVRAAIRAAWPWLDEGNVDWLNGRGRIYLRRLSRSSG